MGASAAAAIPEPLVGTPLSSLSRPPSLLSVSLTVSQSLSSSLSAPAPPAGSANGSVLSLTLGVLISIGGCSRASEPG